MPYDPFDAAMNPPEPKQTERWFGRLFVDVWPCVLISGEGKVPFDPAVHEESKRVTAIEMELVPLPDYDVGFTLERNMVHFAKAWRRVTLPSIQALNVDLRNLHEAYVAAEFKPTGRTWTGQDGEEKKETAFVIVDVFDDQDACQKAYLAYENEDTVSDDGNGANDKERETARMFIEPLWNQAGGNKEKLAQLLAGNPLTNKYFTINSEEVQEVIAQ